MDGVVVTILGMLAVIAMVAVGVYVFWRMRSMLQIWRAPDRPLRSVQALIWRDPGDPAALDLAGGRGGVNGQPLPPFVFIEEHLSGSRPCVSVRDARGLRWRVKWGDEVNVETLATRLAWAAGYFVETTYYVPKGRIEGAASLTRASASLDEHGSFRNARFELDEEGVLKHFDAHSWSWADNPFVGSPELNGLKIVMMWVSNWDAKDVRDVARGSNTAIFEYPGPAGMREARYLVIDWGGALGRWGGIATRGRWDCYAFAEETAAFVSGVEGDVVTFGYTGQHTADIAQGIRVSDVQWLMRRLDALSEAQIAEAVRVSGGTAEEVAVFSRALRGRLDMLSNVAANPSARSPGVRASAVL
jgi:hypothetical protein